MVVKRPAQTPLMPMVAPRVAWPVTKATVLVLAAPTAVRSGAPAGGDVVQMTGAGDGDAVFGGTGRAPLQVSKLDQTGDLNRI